ncbi:hypothetical protein GWI33_013195 [Rhynchophorus ferrugineus]|uniref:Uncharacterized protein n=1 Tax=Rhynchophorus ferrugineus TaxID=354439 RepID=A0A834MBT1_RHYFE|nr:hypothetical protein GWI33_013195 [Rhynchophorus ferrugineus]
MLMRLMVRFHIGFYTENIQRKKNKHFYRIFFSFSDPPIATVIHEIKNADQSRTFLPFLVTREHADNPFAIPPRPRSSLPHSPHPAKYTHTYTRRAYVIRDASIRSRHWQVVVEPGNRAWALVPTASTHLARCRDASSTSSDPDTETRRSTRDGVAASERWVAGKAGAVVARSDD